MPNWQLIQELETKLFDKIRQSLICDKVTLMRQSKGKKKEMEEEAKKKNYNSHIYKSNHFFVHSFLICFDI